MAVKTIFGHMKTRALVKSSGLCIEPRSLYRNLLPFFVKKAGLCIEIYGLSIESRSLVKISGLWLKTRILVKNPVFG